MIGKDDKNIMSLAYDDATVPVHHSPSKAPQRANELRTHQTSRAPVVGQGSSHEVLFAPMKEHAEMTVPSDFLLDDDVETPITENDFVDADLSVGALPDAVQYYLQAIGRTALLNAKREIELARKIEVLLLLESVRTKQAMAAEAAQAEAVQGETIQLDGQRKPPQRLLRVALCATSKTPALPKESSTCCCRPGLRCRQPKRFWRRCVALSLSLRYICLLMKLSKNFIC
ncbi:MAG: hypothetical protein EBS29_00380 [Chloroflexia bacterium]|nr:hypothetical protein [Chloroflexia bacterium]